MVHAVNNRPTMAYWLQKGITTADLYQALQTAVDFEFSTIPLYLTAYWCCQDSDDTATTLRNIAVEEMYHLAIAGNILSSLTKTDTANNIYKPKMNVPNFPTQHVLTGMTLSSPINLDKFDRNQAVLFTEIEFPSFSPVAGKEDMDGGMGETVGHFYEAIINALPDEDSAYSANEGHIIAGDVIPISKKSDAVAQIRNIILANGEGTKTDPTDGQGNLAHYYAFQQYLKGYHLVKNQDGWHYDENQPMPYPVVYDIKGYENNADFTNTLMLVLNEMQEAWSTPGSHRKPSSMSSLTQSANDSLTKRGMIPQWIDSRPK